MTLKTQTFSIKGSLPGLNEYTRACRANRYAGAQMKLQAEEVVGWAIKQSRIKPIDAPVHVSFMWREKNQRRDCDNVAFAKKFILDALVAAGILAGDGRKYVTSFHDRFAIDAENPRVIVSLAYEERTTP
jgi:Holliday junction resolvase RusA-like endonuclease